MANLETLERAFNAARGYNDNESKASVCKKFDISRKALHDFFNGDMTSKPLEKKIRNYVYESGLKKSIDELEERTTSKVAASK